MPPVNVEELKHFRELIESLSEELAPPVDSGPAKGSIATDGLQSLVEKVCGPGSNARVLSRRNGVLEMFLRKGYLPRYKQVRICLEPCCSCCDDSIHPRKS